MPDCQVTIRTVRSKTELNGSFFKLRVVDLLSSCLRDVKKNFHFHTMACSGLSAVREALIIANVEEIIDDEDFVYLYDAFSSRPVYPYWKFEKFDENVWSDT